MLAFVENINQGINFILFAENINHGVNFVGIKINVLNTFLIQQYCVFQ